MRYTVLFLCLGNICRSPAAEMILKKELRKRNLQGKVSVKSYGLMDWSQGLSIDPRMQKVLEKKGIPIDHSKRSELISLKELEKADEIFVASSRVEKTLLQEYSLETITGRIQLITSMSKKYHNLPIKDPFTAEDPSIFEHVADMLIDSCKGIAEDLAVKISVN